MLKDMKTLVIFAFVFCFGFFLAPGFAQKVKPTTPLQAEIQPSSASTNNGSTSSATDEIQISSTPLLAGEQAPMASCDVYADIQQCCSDSSCAAKVLNNRDQHNCKRSGGHGWHAASHNGQPAKCVRP